MQLLVARDEEVSKRQLVREVAIELLTELAAYDRLHRELRALLKLPLLKLRDLIRRTKQIECADHEERDVECEGDD